MGKIYPTAVGFDLGDTLCEYAGVPLDWEREYPAALSAVAARCGREMTPPMLKTGVQLLLRYNTRRVPRAEEYSAERIFAELLAAWGMSTEYLNDGIGAFFAHFRKTLRVFPDALATLQALHRLAVRTGVLTDVPYGMPTRLLLEDVAASGLPVSQGPLLEQLIDRLAINRAPTAVKG